MSQRGSTTTASSPHETTYDAQARSSFSTWRNSMASSSSGGLMVAIKPRGSSVVQRMSSRAAARPVARGWRRRPRAGGCRRRPRRRRPSAPAAGSRRGWTRPRPSRRPAPGGRATGGNDSDWPRRRRRRTGAPTVRRSSTSCAAHDREGPRGDVVVVKARVVVLAAPADEPDVDAVVGPQELEDPRLGSWRTREAHSPGLPASPSTRERRSSGREGLGGGREQGIELSDHASTSWGAKSRAAPMSSRTIPGPPRGWRAGSITGRSEP